MTDQAFHILNGELEQGQFQITSSNRAFRYGDGLFETIKVSQGKPLFYRSHYSRMVLGLDALKMEIPGFFTFQYFHDRLIKLLQANKCFNGSIRVQAYRAGDGTYTPRAYDFNWIAESRTDKENNVFFDFNTTDYELGVYHEVKKNFSPISFFKSCNAQPYVLAGFFAKENNYNNAILFNSDDKVVETVAENIFIYNDGRVETPPITDGAVDGIMRSMLKKILKWNKIELVERSLVLDDIVNAQEVFLSNSNIGIQPVSQLIDKTYPNDFSKGLNIKLNERVAQLLERS